MNFLPLCTPSVCPPSRDHGRAARPGAPTLSFRCAGSCRRSSAAGAIDERAFFGSTCHIVSVLLLSAGHDELIGPLVLRVLYRALAGPTESPDDAHRWSCLHHRRAGGRTGSWPRRGLPDGVPASACGRPCRWKYFRGPGCRPVRRRHAIHQYATGLTRGQLEQGVSPSFATNCACAPAERAICAPLPGFNSQCCGRWCQEENVTQGQGITDQDAASGPLTTFSRLPSSDRVHDVALLAVGVVEQGLRAERLGWYDGGGCGGNADLSRLKSMMRSLRLCRRAVQMVRSSRLRRPPERCFGSVIGLYGRLVVRSSLTVGRSEPSVGVTGL